MWRNLILLMLLAGCAAPSAEFRDIPAIRIVVEGSVFDVRVKGNKAEAIRINAESAPRMGRIGVRAALAIEAASGCRVSRIDGDQAMIRARLACGKAKAKPLWPDLLRFHCEVDDVDARLSGAEMTCRLEPG